MTGGFFMVLSKTTKEKIINVRDYYEKMGRFVDIDFINEILSLIQKEELFQGLFQYEFVKYKTFGPAYTTDKAAYFNVDLVMKWIKEIVEYNFSDYPQKDMVQYYNFMALLVILHESSHVWQYKELENYSEINRLHSDINCSKKFRLKEIVKLVKFYINVARLSNHAYYERQANIDALRELVEMYQGYHFLDFIQLQHIYNLSLRPKGESIVHDNLQIYGLDFNYHCDGIPKDLLFEVGLPTGQEYSDSVYAMIDNYRHKDVSYEKVIERIRAF